MKLLIAEDDDFFQKILQQVLGTDHEIIMVNNGDEAWAILQRADAPQLAILDWVMPGLTGPQVCRNVRACPELSSMYLMMSICNNDANEEKGHSNMALFIQRWSLTLIVDGPGLGCAHVYVIPNNLRSIGEDSLEIEVAIPSPIVNVD